MTSFKLPAIYPITNRELSGLSHAEQVRQLAESGCRFVQIREKSAPSREFYEAVVEAVSIANRIGMKIIVNDRVDIAIAAGAHGVHLGQEDMPAAEARKLLGEEAILGYSTHSVEQALEATKMPVDYIAVGPVYATTTKEDPDPVIGLEGIKRIRSAVGTQKLVAIGGINLDNVSSVISAGADSAAIISELYCDQSEIGLRYQALTRAAQTV